MLRLLGRDSGARQSLMRILSVKDLASLIQSGHSWSAWISGFSSVGDQTVMLHSRSQDSFLQCHWIQRSLQNLRYECNDDNPLRFDRMLGSLHKLNRLRSLAVTLASRISNPQLLREALSSVAATLRHLEATVTGTTLDVSALLSGAAALPLLESLAIRLRSPPDRDEFLGADETEDPLNFSCLSTLATLRRFLLIREDIGKAVPLTPEQVVALANCRALTDLRCGQWMLELNECYHLPLLLPDQLAHIETGIATLVKLRKANGAAPLRRLHLGSNPVIVSENWRWLSQFTELESLVAGWKLDPEEWMQLANFQHLDFLAINGLFDGAPKPPELAPILAPLVHCRALRFLSLGTEGLDLRKEDATMLARIPALEHLYCYRLCIDSLAPFAEAPALTELELDECTGLFRVPINIREMIPSMPHLSVLTIHEYPANPMNAMEAEPFNVELMRRLPSLTLANFTQLNLRPHPDSVD